MCGKTDLTSVSESKAKEACELVLSCTLRDCLTLVNFKFAFS